MRTDEATRLAHMSSQIATFFQAWPEDQAVAAIAGHINQFWAPPMRRDFVTLFGDDPAPLHPLTRRALPLIRIPAAR